jgi:hypothetical protein
VRFHECRHEPWSDHRPGFNILFTSMPRNHVASRVSPNHAHPANFLHASSLRSVFAILLDSKNRLVSTSGEILTL